MSERTETTVVSVERLQPWQGGVAAGLAGGLAMGLFMSIQTPGVIETAIPALWTLEGGTAGWVIHMINSAVFGVAFAAVAREWPQSVDSAAASAVTGGAFGAALWLLAAALVMPVWLEVVGFASPPPLPNFDFTSLGAHLIYGIVLGICYPLVVGREPEL